MRLLIPSFLLSLIAIVVSAANFSGKWVMERPGTGQTRQELTLILNQVGNQVTGSITGRTDAFSASPVNTEILDGTVDGEMVKFYVWTGLDRPTKAFYKGTLSGEEINFTVTGQDSSQKITARRAK